MNDKKKTTITSKKYSVSIQATNGTVITALGPNASITINNRINAGGVPHYQCQQCGELHPVGYKH